MQVLKAYQEALADTWTYSNHPFNICTQGGDLRCRAEVGVVVAGGGEIPIHSADGSHGSRVTGGHMGFGATHLIIPLHSHGCLCHQHG